MNFTPVPNPTASYWLSEPHRLASFCSSAAVPEQVDIAIVGTGLAGVATAYHILKNSDPQKRPSITLIEARDACSGATARNGGHIKIKLESLKGWYDKHGVDAAAELVAWSEAQRHCLQKIAEEEGIECEFQVRRSFDMFFDEEHAAALKSWLTARQKEGFTWLNDMQWVEGPYLDRITGVKGAVGAFSSPAISLWPYKFVTGLLERVIELGATLHTNTPVESIQNSNTEGSPVVLSTSRGEVRATKVVYASNGYVAGLLPQYRRVIVPILGQNSRIVPNQATLDRLPTIATTFNFHYSAAWVDYLNPRPDGAVIHGGGGRSLAPDDRSGKGLNSRFNSVDDSRLLNDQVAEDFRAFDEQHFYGWENSEAKVGSTWTVMGITTDGLPHAGRVPGTSNQWILAGFNGGGMLLIPTMTQGIAKMVAQGEELEDTNIPAQFKTTEARLSNIFTEISE
ncbi:FAD dependent oxidoreductase [Akanthomyces lecanii RCEF 1005]|uniref:FAD dependent oxidoreductase n=1 Tax=Akanthomyces lecanii RCEF 1005 TaxID=1081108 RepID=A0A168FYL0_CORDF|nr:FAD dependent oxidoreductase [Akanthomyces lecanii RCEF 1005]